MALITKKLEASLMPDSDNIIDLVPAARRWHEKLVTELLAHIGQAEPKSFEYLGDGRVLVSLKTTTGEMLQYVTSSAGLMRTADMATKCVNENLSDILSDIGVF